MATDTDAARERVLVARAQLGDEMAILEASARAAVDIPAKVKASPVKAAAVAGTAGFLVLRGPKRVAGGLRRAIKGPSAPMPKRMLPNEIEKTLSLLGSDGDAVRGVIERDFAAYATQAARDRHTKRNLITAAIVQPFLIGGTRAAAKWLFSADQETFAERLATVRGRLDQVVAKGLGRETPSASTPGTPRTGSPRDDAEDESGA